MRFVQVFIKPQDELFCFKLYDCRPQTNPQMGETGYYNRDGIRNVWNYEKEKKEMQTKHSWVW